MKSKDLSKLYSKLLWIWYVVQCGGVEGIIKTAKETGADGVIVKCADGTTPWVQFNDSVQALKAAGLTVGAWAYVYPTDPQAQARVIADSCHGADYLLIDAESEYEAAGMDTAAEELGKALRAILSDLPIGLTTFAIPRYHRAFPYLQFAHWVDFIAPQVYWADAGMSPQSMLDSAIHGLSGYGLEIFPVGQAYPQATAADIAEFALHCTERWIKGVSWWDVQHMTPEIRTAVGASEIYRPVIHKPVDKPPERLDAKQTATVAEIEKLAEELKSE